MNDNDVKLLVRDHYGQQAASAGLAADRLAPQVAGKVISAFVRAVTS